MTIPDFRHPQEVQRLESMQGLKLLNLILNLFNTAYANITSFATVAERNYPVSNYTEPRVHRLYVTAKEKLGVEADVPIYLKFDYALSAETVGTDGDCAIIISSCCLDTLNDDELMSVLARELGHIAYKHVKYLNIIKFFDDLTQKISGIAETTVLTTKNILLEWMRCAEYTADRAAAIAVGSVEAPCMATLKAMGAVQRNGQIDFDLKKVVSEPLPPFPEERLGKVGQIAFQNIMSSIAVPFGMLRVKELWHWSQSEECKGRFTHVYFSNSWTFCLEKQKDANLLYSKAEKLIPSAPDKALALLHRSARCGSSAAMYYLGNIYFEGKLVRKDPLQAMRYLQFAVASKYPAAYTRLGECFLHGIPDVCPENKDMGYRYIRCARDKADVAAQKYLMKYKKPPLAMINCVSSTVKNIASQKKKYNCIFLMDKKTDDRQWRDYLDIPRDEKILVLVVNEDYQGQYLAICTTGIYFYTEKKLPQYLSWVTVAKQDLVEKRLFGRVDLMAGDVLLYSCDENTKSCSVIPLVTMIQRNLRKNV